jgi:drug/metabolite transporter (DMT)-like permease
MASQPALEVAARPRRRKWLDFGALIIANAMFGAQYPATKAAVSGLGPTLLSILTFLLASICVVPFLIAEARAFPKQLPLRQLGSKEFRFPFLMATVFGLLPASVVLSWGVDRSLASNGALLTLSIPVLTAMVASAVRTERMTTLRWLSFALAVVGAAITSEIEWRTLSLANSRYLFGNALVLVGCLGNGFNNVFSKELLERYSPVRLLVVTYLATAVFCVPILLWFEPQALQTLLSAPAKTWFGLLVLGAFSWGLGMVIWFRLLARLEATQVAVSLYLLPFFGILLSAIFLGEKISSAIIAGGCLSAVGTAVVLFEDVRPRAKSEAVI